MALYRTILALAAVVVPALPAAGQQAPPPSPPASPAVKLVQSPPTTSASPSPAADGVAATVNGQPIPETAVQRELDQIPPARHAEARPDIINFLIEIALIDQHLAKLNIPVDQKDIDAQIEKAREESKKEGKNLEEVLQKLRLNEAELRTHIAATLRWNKYLAGQVSDKEMRDFFEANRDMFDGSAVRARHILLTPPSNDPQAGEKAKAELLLIRKQVEDQVAAGMAKLPANADNLTREQTRTRLIDEAFATQARAKSVCPSKEQGGDLGEFPRLDGMVEPFARAAFALKPYEMSDVVKTQFGYHLILSTAKRAGKEVKFDDVKPRVKEVCAERLREKLIGQLRQTATIQITPVKN